MNGAQREFLKVAGLAGKKTLRGTVRTSGAKNAALKALPAALLFSDEVLLTNVPRIEDVSRMVELLRSCLVEVEDVDEASVRVKVGGSCSTVLRRDIAERMRSSVVLTGPMLARFGSVSLPHPGGCVIGERPIDLFLEGFLAMGAHINESDGLYELSAKGGLRGADIFFPIVSVIATETLMMAAVLAKGTTVLRNAAMEPEILHLANFLNACGASIRGAGTTTITIKGGELLTARGRTYRVMPDRIEAGSFLILGALTADELSITDCEPEHLQSLVHLLLRSGVPIEQGQHSLHLRGNGARRNDSFKAFSVRTHEYPGFATDLQAPVTVFLTQVTGESKVFESIFEGRLNYTADLVGMGADITMGNPHQVRIKGPTRLRGAELHGPDLRAGLAYVIAALVAEGPSIINNVYYIDRGYERLDERLRSLGADVVRESVSTSRP